MYSNEINSLRQSPDLEIEFEFYAGKRLKGEIVFDNSRLEANTKSNLVRIKVDNRNYDCKPGMMTYVYLGRNKNQTVVIPKSVLLLENYTTVWIETPDGLFGQRMVETGISSKREAEIISGLTEGD